MHILICADIEGVAGVVHTEQCQPGNSHYEQARHWMTQEVNAAISGALSGGAHHITVADGHAGYRNLQIDLLHPQARVASGKPRALGMLATLDADYSALMLVGFHARASASGVLAHTINSSAFARVWLNEVETGEAGLYGALAGERGIPVIFASGDDAFIRETTPSATQAVFVETKQSLGRCSAISLSPQLACARIEAGAKQAITLVGKCSPMHVDLPVQVRIQTQTPTHADLFCQWPTLKRLDAVHLEYQVDTVEAAIRILNCLSAMSVSLR